MYNIYRTNTYNYKGEFHMKKYFALLAAAAMVLSVTGCSSDENVSGVVSDISSAVSQTENSDSSQTESTTTDDKDDASSQPQENITDNTAAEIEMKNPMKPDLLSATISEKLGLDNPAAAAAAEKMLPLLMYNNGNPARIAKVMQKLANGEEVTVAYLGGSITQGTGADFEHCYAALTTKWIQNTYPSAKVNYVNAGIGATGSYIGVHRCDEQVLSSNPDLVFIDFSVNDESQNNAINKLTYEGLIRKIWKHSSNPGIICIAMTQDNGTSVQAAHGEVTEKYSVPFVSYHDAMLDFLSSQDNVQWSDISGDNIHPNLAGHAILSSMLTTYLQQVADNLDSIDMTDPALPDPGEQGAMYENAKLLTTDSITPISEGAFKKKDMQFGGFNNPWLARSSDGSFAEGSFEVEIEAQNIGLLYGMLTHSAGLADIYIDGEFVTTINSDFTGGWGNYVQFAEIKRFDEKAKHTLKITPRGAAGSPAAFYISGITVS